MPARPVLSPETLRWLPWVVAIAFFMQSLDGTILNNTWVIYYVSFKALF